MNHDDMDKALSTASRVEWRIFGSDGHEDLSVVLRGAAIRNLREHLTAVDGTSGDQSVRPPARSVAQEADTEVEIRALADRLEHGWQHMSGCEHRDLKLAADKLRTLLSAVKLSIQEPAVPPPALLDLQQRLVDADSCVLRQAAQINDQRRALLALVTRWEKEAMTRIPVESDEAAMVLLQCASQIWAELERVK